MSKWTDFRDAIEADVADMKLDEKVKQELTKNLTENVLPAVSAWVDKIAAGLQEDAKMETGWCKIRDALVLPALMDLGLYAARKLLEATDRNTRGTA